MEKFWGILTFLVALYGAALSTHIFYKSRKSEKANMFISHGYSYEYEFDQSNIGSSLKTLRLYAVNHSKHEIVVENLSLEIPGFGLITPCFLDLFSGKENSNNKYEVSSTRLKHGDRIDISFDYTSLIQMIRNSGVKMPMKTRAVCEDSLENFFFSSRFEIEEK